MSDDLEKFTGMADVLIGDLQMEISKAVQHCADLVPQKRLQVFKERVAKAQDAVEQHLSGKAKEMAARWQVYGDAVKKHLEPGERDPVERLLEYFELKDLRQEMSQLESNEIRKLVADGIQQGDDKFLRAASMGLRPLASPDFLQAQEQQHIDNRLRSTEMGAKLADGRYKLEAAQQAIESAAFKTRRQATKLIEDGSKAAVNQPVQEPTIGRNYADYAKEKAARQALDGVASVQG